MLSKPKLEDDPPKQFGGSQKDPVCGMTVDPHTAKHRASHGGHSYYFCSAGCKTKFEADPDKYLKPQVDSEPVPADAVFTCPRAVKPLVGAT